jgi:linoleoyl-CoA desaturase
MLAILASALGMQRLKAVSCWTRAMPQSVATQSKLTQISSPFMIETLKQRPRPTFAHQIPNVVTPGELKFGENDEFHRELRKRVDNYFEETGINQRDCPQMYLKTAVILTTLIATYVLLLFVVSAWWQVIPLAVLLGLSMAAVGFNIQHDGSHGAYSSRPWVNRLMAMSLDLLGGSSHVWARKHNSIHHSFANITGHDDDINLGFLGRLSPYQKRLPFHRLQHFYLWFLYGFLATKWQLFDDLRDNVRGRIGGHRFARPRGWNLAVLVGGKTLFFTLAFVIPMLMHPVWTVLAVYAIASFVQGVSLSVVFQLAHCVQEASFPMPAAETRRMESPWAVHQVETTVDFARDSRIVSWLVGGLNFQIEHHLFPRICHIHYPAIAPVVERTCKDFGVRYVAHETLFDGVRSHYRLLRELGKPDHVRQPETSEV